MQVGEVANSSDDQVLSGIPQPSCLFLEAENIMLACELVPTCSVTRHMTGGGNSAIMNNGILYFTRLPCPDPVLVAMTASAFFGFIGCMIIICVEEDVLFWALVG